MVAEGDWDGVLAHLLAKADVEARGIHGYTALHYDCPGGHSEIAQAVPRFGYWLLRLAGSCHGTLIDGAASAPPPLFVSKVILA